ncbi:hypothetical protein SAMN05445850_1543 [Paraburkholderia tuberum]|uniref:Uncharacterized protein n=1 Tax=Paraburkholderia tuberum TaxID=157910 RepID=A0A1H1D764_9BURK|nr:hypothetical protein SAMN05445850_1543 [Paraburkholderia tuberum]
MRSSSVSQGLPCSVQGSARASPIADCVVCMTSWYRPAMSVRGSSRLRRRSGRADPTAIFRRKSPRQSSRKSPHSRASGFMSRCAPLPISVVQRVSRIARRSTRGRARTLALLFAPIRAPCRASNEKHRTGRAQRPDAQYYQPFFHYTNPREPRLSFLRALKPTFRAVRLRASVYRRAKSFDKAYFKKNHARESTDRKHPGSTVGHHPETHVP